MGTACRFQSARVDPRKCANFEGSGEPTVKLLPAKRSCPPVRCAPLGVFVVRPCGAHGGRSECPA